MGSKSFTDLRGNTWTIEASRGVIVRVRTSCRVELGSVEPFAETWSKILLDDNLAESVIWAAVSSSSENRTLDEFRDAMGGPQMAEATQALLEAICDCYPAKAAVYRNIAKRVEERLAAAHDEACKLIDQVPDELPAAEQFVANLKAAKRCSR